MAPIDFTNDQNTWLFSPLYKKALRNLVCRGLNLPKKRIYSLVNDENY